MSEALRSIAQLLREVDEMVEKTSSKAQDFISNKISVLRKEGYPEKQAVAIAFSMAKKRGFAIPEAPKDEDDSEKSPKECPAETPETPKESDEDEKDSETPDSETAEPKEEIPAAPPEAPEAPVSTAPVESPVPVSNELLAPPAEVAGAGGEVQGGEDEEEPIDDPLASLEMTERQMGAALREYKDFCEFVDMYKDGNSKAFKKPMSENRSLGIIPPLRPPRRLFEKLVESIEKRHEVNNAEVVASWVWYNWTKPEVKSRLCR